MRTFIITLVTMVLLIGYSIPSMAVRDMRATAIEAEKNRKKLMNMAELESQTAKEEAKKSNEKIFQDKKTLEEAIKQQKNKNLLLTKKSLELKTKIQNLKAGEQEIRAKLADKDAVLKELAGFVRICAKDLDAMVGQSLQSALIKNRKAAIQPLLKSAKFPAMKDIKAMKDILMDEIMRSGQVRIEQGKIIDQSGKEVLAKILVLGNFTAAYELDGNTGFLLFSDESQQLFALSKQPSTMMQKAIKNYIRGESDAVPIDISKGSSIRQLTHKLSLVEQIPKGGPVVWPILVLALLAAMIIVERFIFLLRKNINAAVFMANLKKRMAIQDWDGCKELFATHGKKPLARALSAGMEFRTRKRTDMENALQEAILREIPPLERFLSTLGMLAAIAPLMGLLGTVTGMINTFHIITFYGTSDPRMMSGGISEALVTTMLGLCIAIPIMLCHTLLSRWVENIIATMEEKAVAMVNAMFIIGNREC